MNIDDLLAYLTKQQVLKNITSYEQISVGQSGAKLWVVHESDRNYVIKLIHKSFMTNEQMISYQKEFAFYELNKTLKLSYVPKVLALENHEEYGMFMVMEYLKPISCEEWNLELLKNAVDLCAQFNCIGVEKVASLGIKHEKVIMDEEFNQGAYEAWKKVLGEHPGQFDETILNEIYHNINLVCPILNDEPQYVCHGDFHPENILTDGKQLYICDWQGIQIGKCIGDLGFFISRGKGFGIDMKEDRLLEYYCQRLSFYQGCVINKSTLLREKNASTLLTDFSFWANYLHGSSYDRVAAQYKEMVNAYQNIL